jgi:hypothetical protein
VYLVLATGRALAIAIVPTISVPRALLGTTSSKQPQQGCLLCLGSREAAGVPVFVVELGNKM